MSVLIAEYARRLWISGRQRGARKRWQGENLVFAGVSVSAANQFIFVILCICR